MNKFDELFKNRPIICCTGWSKKRHKVNDIIVLQPQTIKSCGFQQNVLKVILYMIKVSI